MWCDSSHFPLKKVEISNSCVNSKQHELKGERGLLRLQTRCAEYSTALVFPLIKAEATALMEGKSLQRNWDIFVQSIRKATKTKTACVQQHVEYFISLDNRCDGAQVSSGASLSEKKTDNYSAKKLDNTVCLWDKC